MDKELLIKFTDKIIDKYMAVAFENLKYCENCDVNDTKQAIEEECTALKYEFSELLNNGDDKETAYAKVLNAYQNNIAPITTIVRESILDWMETMDVDVIVWAIGEAVKHNVRTWRYVEAILQNHANAGRTTLAAVKSASRNYSSEKEFDVYHSDTDHDALEKIIMGKL